MSDRRPARRVVPHSVLLRVIRFIDEQRPQGREPEAHKARELLRELRACNAEGDSVRGLEYTARALGEQIDNMYLKWSRDIQ